MSFLSTNWGDVATAIGVFISLGGFIWAIWEAHGARSAAQEARDKIVNHLQTVDLQRAIGLIRLVKTLHDNDQWLAAREHYQTLREMLAGIITRCPDNLTELRRKLSMARQDINDMDELVEEQAGQEIGKPSRSRLNRSLNNIQSDLEQLASATSLGESERETQ